MLLLLYPLVATGFTTAIVLPSTCSGRRAGRPPTAIVLPTTCSQLHINGNCVKPLGQKGLVVVAVLVVPVLAPVLVLLVLLVPLTPLVLL